MTDTARDLAVSALETLFQRHGQHYIRRYDRDDLEVFVDAIIAAVAERE